MTRPLRIGLSPRILHNPPAELGFRNKTLQYLEQSVAHWIMRRHALAFMLPAIESGGVERSSVRISDSTTPVAVILAKKRSKSLHRKTKGARPLSGNENTELSLAEANPVSCPWTKGELADKAIKCGI